jgi:IS30 family transposase
MAAGNQREYKRFTAPILPKGIDLSVFSQEDLDAVAWALNTRPRKSLSFKCPAELFLPDTFNADEYYRRLVALHV